MPYASFKAHRVKARNSPRLCRAYAHDVRGTLRIRFMALHRATCAATASRPCLSNAMGVGVLPFVSDEDPQGSNRKARIVLRLRCQGTKKTQGHQRARNVQPNAISVQV